MKFTKHPEPLRSATFSPPQTIEASAKKLVELTETAEDSLEYAHVWNSEVVRAWFLLNGYTLYHIAPVEDGLSDFCYPASLSSTPNAVLQSDPGSDKYPFAYISNSTSACHPCATSTERASVFFAEDRNKDHIAIKVVRNSSQECKILRKLYERHLEGKTSVQNHVIPMLDILELKDFSFAIMPRWGIIGLVSAFDNIEQVFHFVHCLLKGLDFLHQNCIFHGDIRLASILRNNFDNWDPFPHNEYRKKLREDNLLDYALFDFSHSILFSPNTDLAKCYLPKEEAWRGSWCFRPNDTDQGESSFNPFAWDVCAMGLTIGIVCNPVLTIAPMLAPLLDQMLNRSVQKRFTARQALDFFEQQVCANTPSQQLQKVYPEILFRSRFDPDEDRWKNLDPDFVKRWAAFSQPKLPWTTRVLRYAYSVRFLRNFVPTLQRFFADS